VKRRGVASEARQGEHQEYIDVLSLHRQPYRISSAFTTNTCIPICCVQHLRAYFSIKKWVYRASRVNAVFTRYLEDLVGGLPCHVLYQKAKAETQTCLLPDGPPSMSRPGFGEG
jgi:hypothetical protein